MKEERNKVSKEQPIDKKIRNLIIELNKVGLETCSSCEGHNGNCAWVSFTGKDIKSVSHIPGYGFTIEWQRKKKKVKPTVSEKCKTCSSEGVEIIKWAIEKAYLLGKKKDYPSPYTYLSNLQTKTENEYRQSILTEFRERVEGLKYKMRMDDDPNGKWNTAINKVLELLDKGE